MERRLGTRSRNSRSPDVWGSAPAFAQPEYIGAPEEERDAARRHSQQMGGGSAGIGAIGFGTVVIIVLTGVCLGYVIHINSHTGHINREHHSTMDVGNECYKVEYYGHGTRNLLPKPNGAKCNPVCYNDDVGRCSTEVEGCDTCTRCISAAANCSGLCNITADCPTLALRPGFATELDAFLGDDDDIVISAQCLDGICVNQLNIVLAASINFPEHTSQHVDDEFCMGLLDRNDSYSRGCVVGGAMYANATMFHNCKYIAECALHRREPMASPASRPEAFAIFHWMTQLFFSIFGF